MYADAKLELVERPMSDLKGLDGVQVGDSHSGDLPRMRNTVAHR